MKKPIWQPALQRIEESNLISFIKSIEEREGIKLTDYSSLYKWSIDDPARFWLAAWKYSHIIGCHGDVVVKDLDKMPGASWFPDATLNYSENLLRYCDDDGYAIIFRGEDKVNKSLTRKELYNDVSKLAQALVDCGVKPGDRVVGVMPNLPETVIALLAAASIGAIWSSCSPDFAVQSVLDRFSQIQPKILFICDGYFYKGKSFDCLQKARDIAKALPSIEQVVIIEYSQKAPVTSIDIKQAITWSELLASYESKEIIFAQLPFDHPLYILYSSGTTGVPKCIVHGAGGSLIQHVKEHLFHNDVKYNDRLFYYTTCGWMMWNWLVTGLASGATLVLYDGSPFYPDSNVLLDYIDNKSINIFGTSAKYIDALRKQGVVPCDTHKLVSLKTILSTGSPLSPENYDYVYRNIKSDVCLSSISGGTDIVSCFAQGNPVLPVWPGELQCLGLGLRVEVYDEQGQSIRNEKGELVCTAPFPSMPVGFWNDHDNTKYNSTYFNKYPGVWSQGDLVMLTEHDGLIIYGRSDTTLNPGGVRIGTAEIYRQVETFDEILESLVIGQEWEGDTRIVLFVKLKSGFILNEKLITQIKKQIRKNTSSRHVPAKILQVNDVPRTRSGKIVEVVVRDIVHGKPAVNKDSLENPEVLGQYENRIELQT